MQTKKGVVQLSGSRVITHGVQNKSACLMINPWRQKKGRLPDEDSLLLKNDPG
jgi:hypothetical protein